MQSRNTLLSTIFSTLPNIFIVYYIINPPAKVLKVLLQSPLESITLHYQEAVTWGICQNINSKFVQIFPYCIFFNHQLSQNTKWDRNVRTILSPANKKINKLFETRNCFKANNTSFLYSSSSLFQYNASSLIILYGEYKPASCERKPVHNESWYIAFSGPLDHVQTYISTLQSASSTLEEDFFHFQRFTIKPLQRTEFGYISKTNIQELLLVKECFLKCRTRTSLSERDFAF